VQTVKVPEQLGHAKILPKTSSHLGAATLQMTDRQQTDGSCLKSNMT